MDIVDSDICRVHPDALVSLFKRIGPSLRVLAFYINWEYRFKEKFYEALLRAPEFCPNLETIAIRGCAGIPEWMRFDTFSALKRFSAESVPISAATFASIPPSIQVVEGLNLTGGGRTWETLEAFLRSHPRLRRVLFFSLSSGTVGANLYETIAESCPQLKSLHFWNVTSVAGLECLEGMKEIVVDYRKQCPPLTNKQLLTLCARNPEIQVLQIGNFFFASDITVEAWMAMASLSKLRNVGLLNAVVNVDVLDELILNSGPTLECMDVGRKAFPVSILDRISERCPRLRSIQICLAFSGDLEAKIGAFVDGLIGRRRSRNKPLSMWIHVRCPNAEARQRVESLEQTIRTRHPGIGEQLMLR